MITFCWSGTTFGVILFAYNTLSPFSEKVEKTMQKGTPKVISFGPKAAPEHPRFDFGPKNNICGLSFGIDFLMFFENGESVL